MTKPRHRALGALIAVVTIASSAIIAPDRAYAVPTPGEQAAMERRRGAAEESARQQIESLFSRLCPGRCELVEVRAITREPKMVGEVTPGFEGEGATGSYEVELDRLEALVMMDSTLPRPFLANVPRMLQFRLAKITPNVVITPTVLEFPKPQAAPMPEIEEPPEPEPEIEEPPEPEPEPEPEVEAPAPEPTPEVPWYTELWHTLLPYLPYILILLLVSGIIWVMLDRARGLVEATTRAATDGTGDRDTAGMPDVDALRRELRQSRAIQNEVLRHWLIEDPSSVALLVKMIGPDILEDLKQDGALRTPLAQVSEAVAHRAEPLQDSEARRIAREAHARLTAARVTSSQTDLASDWEFVEGLSVPALQRVMARLSAREKGYALGKLPPSLRASYLEQMHPRERRELFVDAGSAETLSREEAIRLASRLRDEAAQIAHIGGESSGQAAIVVEMLQSVDLQEQLRTLSELRARRPEVAHGVLSQLCLETCALVAPHDVLADAILRTPIESMARFARGTLAPIQAHVLEHAPSNITRALQQELSLELPLARSEFLQARAEFTNSLASILQREGEDLASYNVRAMDALAATQSPS